MMHDAMTALNALTDRADRAEQALALAITQAEQGQGVQALGTSERAMQWGANRQLLSRLLITGALPANGRDIALATDIDPQHRVRLRRSLAITPASAGRIGFRPAQPSPRRTAEHLNQLGEHFYHFAYYKRALEYFQRALELAPNDAWICQNLAEAAARLPLKKGDQWEDPQFGQRLDDSGKWDVAVRHYRRALKLDPAKVEQHRQAQRFALEPASAEQIDNPIFIVGCGHSGTSLLLAILGNHPRIHPIPKESALFLHTDAKIQATFRQWDADCRAQGKARWVEKTPPHIFQIHRLLAFRPQARVVLLLRDGRDVVCSLKFRQGYGELEDRLDRWIYDNLAGRPYWQHPQVKLIKYEDLVSQTEATLRSLCDFLGEDYDPIMLDYHKTEHRWYSDQIVKPKAIKTHKDHGNNRNWQINQPIFDGRGRWLKEMTEVDKARFKVSPAQALLEDLGYVSDSDW
jgi:hypothetical protein